ncbi:PEP/pyruvate binding domain-containing protein [Desulfonema magnum]|uniref:PEP/pyruvate binding domain-containing protein n=2 Tax=Desulfonema magnum TaxID=45655 RepID=A0A975BRE0_9BACT|nr:PEP/pyruvate binding domain-containing protein [Desulfonema magnum]
MLNNSESPDKFYANFNLFHELMSVKVRDILLVSSPYDAFIIEEDESLTSKIINEYRGLNLSLPPRVTRTSSAHEALALLKKMSFDMVITMPHLDEMDAFSLGTKIKEIHPNLPVILLAHSVRGIYPIPGNEKHEAIDDIFIWSGNSDLLLALVKNAEDRLNAERDTQKAMVRVLILAEDSPVYRSFFLPLIYKEIVRQTQKILGEGINEEHRLLKMRARPKILVAETYDEAVRLCRKFRPFLLGVISDTRLPKSGKLQADAGTTLLSQIRNDITDLPLLLMSSESENREKACQIPAVFFDKNSPNFLADVRNFFLTHLGFGDFVFRMPDGEEVDRADTLRALEEKVAHIPDECLYYHAERNHFSRWIMARSEILLASEFREVRASEFSNADDMRQYIISNIRKLRKWRQKGVVVQFSRDNFDAEVKDFVKIGQGSLGGKARGLAFMSAMLREYLELHEKYSDVNIEIPKTLVISTDGFESFVTLNKLSYLAGDEFSDEEVTEKFLKSVMPEWLLRDLEFFLSRVKNPLSVRSSSLLEDAQFQPYAGLYETYMIPNNHSDFSVRLRHLIQAIKLVYASTYYEGPKAFSKNTSNKPQEEAMAVIIQQVAGKECKDWFYPAISGVTQSHNFYPVSHMKAEEGIAHIAMGMGKTVVEGEKTLRFSPRHPNIMPQFSTVDDILKNAQRYFYALRIRNYPEDLNFRQYSNLERREVDEAEDELPVKTLSSTYIPEEHRIRDSGHLPGPKILTFAPVLKYHTFPLPELLCDLLELGRKGMGCPVEIEFSVNLSSDGGKYKGDFFFLQMRPMAADQERFEVEIRQKEIENAFCYSTQALGNGKNEVIADIVYVKLEDFKAESTVQIASEIDQINAELLKENRPYLLIGPGRWGSSDRWLGIPVQWRNISGVRAIIELRNEKLKADPSQGSHFFQNITSLGIHYITLTEDSQDYFNWKWVCSLPAVRETTFLRHVRLDNAMTLKIDGRKSECVMIRN